jgi:hypothetical protein
MSWKLFTILLSMGILFFAGCVSGRIGFANEQLVGKDKLEIIRLAFAKCERKVWPDGKEPPSLLITFDDASEVGASQTCFLINLEDTLVYKDLLASPRWEVHYRFRDLPNGYRTEDYMEIEFDGQKAKTACRKRRLLSPGCSLP